MKIIIKTVIIFALAGVLQYCSFMLGMFAERENFNIHLVNSPGYYWIDAFGNRAYTK